MAMHSNRWKGLNFYLQLCILFFPYTTHNKRHRVYYHNDEQKKIAQDIIASYGKLCVTECQAAVKFYAAEDYHQQYLLKGGQSAKKNAKETIRCYG